ncbi:MORC family CW-type zinc finger protein 4 isoform X2 [Strix uralensis]|uniref:MORC family CW-type zinc finger protein 4 isoform X2 n=1 Tax=Strix uralensis TaxID=36305 RepID=UPI003DA54A0E
MDNGAGMTPCKLYSMLSFGFTEKTVKRDHPSVGLCDFKSGSMCWGRVPSSSAGLEGLSAWGCFPRHTWAMSMLRLIIPLVSFSQKTCPPPKGRGGQWHCHGAEGCPLAMCAQHNVWRGSDGNARQAPYRNH